MVPAATPDAIALLEALDPDQLVGRLQELERESRALRVLLRAVRARRSGLSSSDYKAQLDRKIETGAKRSG